MNKRIELRDWLVLFIGFGCCVCVSQVMIYLDGPTGKTLWDELFHRMAWAYHGGGGESADWGEPLFFILLSFLFPSGLVGALGALLFLAADFFLRKR